MAFNLTVPKAQQLNLSQMPLIMADEAGNFARGNAIRAKEKQDKMNKLIADALNGENSEDVQLLEQLNAQLLILEDDLENFDANVEFDKALADNALADNATFDNIDSMETSDNGTSMETTATDNIDSIDTTISKVDDLISPETIQTSATDIKFDKTSLRNPTLIPDSLINDRNNARSLLTNNVEAPMEAPVESNLIENVIFGNNSNIPSVGNINTNKSGDMPMDLVYKDYQPSNTGYFDLNNVNRSKLPLNITTPDYSDYNKKRNQFNLYNRGR